ncbi:hypothetical protein AURANDRAFT_67146 [Aureococcus anophagefferens]|uniref:Uncharacterized protein n=1 Tax=Aureococcus anophagefferens TaxID=44056 RepID=F0YK54_AURAN|nr:hypothetical protein AURANDRAFT_67146 [Aureococcus anophagefferens]EGB04529.1 hypothetical protein AURANDRAFT_67146 [Aureococcus anophagefferens]|eukprot:XP_009040782.1 hypothetical protein AURANDRAFT_67146 [Aureococcus anophagefferens]
MMRASQRLQRSCSLFVFVAALFAVVLSRRRDASTTTLDAAPYLRSESWLAATILPLNSSALMPLAARVTYDARGAAAKLGSSWEAAVAVRYAPRYAAPALGNMSFEVGTFAAFELAVPAAGNVSGAKAFNGVVGVDGAGAVVWAYHMDGAEAWDFLPRDAGGGVLLVGKADARTFEADRNGTLARWHANSELREVDFWAGRARGDATSTRASSRGFESARRRSVERSTRGRDSSTSSAASAGGPRSRARAGTGTTTRRPTSAAWTGARRGSPRGRRSWDRASGALEPVYDMRGAAPRAAPRRADGPGGGDGHASLLPTFDFHHVDAVSLGASGDLVVSSRTLNTETKESTRRRRARIRTLVTHVVSCSSRPRRENAPRPKTSRGGVDSTELGRFRELAGLSSSPGVADTGLNASRFAYPFLAFARDADKFYAPHASARAARARAPARDAPRRAQAAIVAASGDLLVVDDGDSRPGCTTAVAARGDAGWFRGRVAAGCFSRVVRYALDAGAGTAAVAWQFEWGVDLASGRPGPEPRLIPGADARAPRRRGALGRGDAPRLEAERGPGSPGPSPVFEFAPDGRGERGGNGAIRAGRFEFASTRAFRDPKEGTPSGKYDLAAKLLLPEPLANNGLQNAYRVVPWDRIHAESHDSPL